MASEHVTLRVGTEGADKVVRDAGKVKSSWLDTAAKLSMVWQAASSVLMSFGRHIADVAKQSAASARDSAQLNAALAQVSDRAGEARAAMDAYAQEMQRVYGVSSDAITTLQKLHIQMTGTTAGVDDSTKAALALSEALGMDAASAMRSLSQAQQGNVAMLGRYIPAVKALTKEQLASGEAARLVSEQFGSALDAKMATAIGQYERLTTILRDGYTKQLGTALMSNQALAVALREVGNELMGNQPTMDVFSTSISKASIGAVTLVASLVDLGGRVVAITYDIRALTMMMAPVEGAFYGATGVIEGFSAAISRFRGKTQEADSAVLRMKAAFELARGSQKDLVKGLQDDGDAARKWSDDFADKIGAITMKMQAAAEGQQNLAVATQRRIKHGMEATVMDLGELAQDMFALENEALAARQRRIEMFMQWRQRAHEEHAEHLNRLAAEEVALNEASEERMKQLASTIGSSLGATMAAIVSDTTSAADAFKSFAITAGQASIDAAVQAVNAAIIAGTAGAFTSQVGVPIVGPALAMAAAATAGAFLKGLLGRLRSYAVGGYHDRDEVVQVHRGERTLSAGETRSAEAREQQQGGGMVINAIIPPGGANSIDADRYVMRHVIPALRRQARLGNLDFLRGAA
jgi:hypothetical protein